MASKIKGIIVEIGGDTVGLQKALKDVNDKAKNVSSEMREVEKALKLNPNNVQLLAQKHKLLAEEVEIAKKTDHKDTDARIKAARFLIRGIVPAVSGGRHFSISSPTLLMPCKRTVL